MTESGVSRAEAPASPAQSVATAGMDLVSGVLRLDDLASDLAQAVLQGTRLRLLAVLSGESAHRRGGHTLQELGPMLACSPQNAHHHLKILHDAGLVRLVRTEATQRIPRQFWISDVQRIEIASEADGASDLALDLAGDGGTTFWPQRLREARFDDAMARRLGASLEGLSDAELDLLRTLIGRRGL